MICDHSGIDQFDYENFLVRVFGCSGALVTDESSLLDFDHQSTRAGICYRVQQIYGVDISNIRDLNLLAVLKLIDYKTGEYKCVFERDG